MPIHYVIEGRPQALAPDGRRLRHRHPGCKLLRQSKPSDIDFNADNTDALRLSTVRCEDAGCWAAERRREGSPFGCVSCGRTDIEKPYRDVEGRYRLCEDCFARRAHEHRDLSGTDLIDRVFEPIVARYEVARRPKLYRPYKTNHCERCGVVPNDPGRLHVHHIDRDRRNNDPANLMTLCRSCHRAEHRSGAPVPYAKR
jgi:5-methylcytosine-specific restriction endonuclease McrA